MRRNSAGGTLPFLPPSSFSTWVSMGRPWQSQPGTIRRAEAGHGLRFHDHVLQDLVEAGAEVNGAGRIGRPVVQDVGGGAGAGLLDALVESGLLPFGQHLGLVLRQAGLHREGRARQIQATFQVKWFGHELRDSVFSDRCGGATAISLSASEASGAPNASVVWYNGLVSKSAL